ncbi:MAG TPA: MBL fold metallo-hydrolase [Vicinamibacterales bacterium]|nr:MBL fold metallo-hydrolase [Vicinamibacterales bacterium]
MSRRIRVAALVAVASISFAGIVARGQEEPKKVVIDTLNVRDTLYHLTGGGGNSLGLWDEFGANFVVVDTKRPGWGRALVEPIMLIGDQPITMIINTHCHLDHTGSNAEIPTVRDIIAHENTKANMAKMDAFKGANAKFLPNKTFTDRLSLLEGINRIELYYFGAGHTNGDIVVVFPEKGVAHVGDLFASKAAPVIDTANGGSGVAYPETLAKAVASIKGISRVITGHTGIPDSYAGAGRRSTERTDPRRRYMTWNDLQEYADFNRDFLSAVRAAMQAGKTAEQAAASLGLPDRYKEYDMTRARANVEAIYAEVKK